MQKSYVILTLGVGDFQRNVICDTNVVDFHKIIEDDPVTKVVIFSADVMKFCYLDTGGCTGIFMNIKVTSIAGN